MTDRAIRDWIDESIASLNSRREEFINTIIASLRAGEIDHFTALDALMRVCMSRKLAMMLVKYALS